MYTPERHLYKAGFARSLRAVQEVHPHLSASLARPVFLRFSRFSSRDKIQDPFERPRYAQPSWMAENETRA